MISRLLVAVVLLQAVLPLGLRTDRVLCLAPDGHVEVEFAGQPCSRVSAEGYGCSCCPEDSADGISSCATCTDIPVLRIDEDTESGRTPDLDPAAPAAIVQPVDPVPPAVFEASHDGPVGESPPLAALRTVVLRF